MASTQLVISLCPEDRERIDALLKALEGAKAPTCDNCVKAVTEMAVAFGQGDPIEEPAPFTADTPAPDESPTEAPTAPAVSKSDVQHLVISLASSGRKDAAREIVKTYAEKVSGIPEDKLAEVYAKLQQLEASA